MCTIKRAKAKKSKYRDAGKNPFKFILPPTNRTWVEDELPTAAVNIFCLAAEGQVSLLPPELASLSNSLDVSEIRLPFVLF